MRGVREGYLHRHGVKKLREFAQTNGYEIHSVPFCKPDMLMSKDNELLIIEVKTIGLGYLNLHTIIQGVGQLLYYAFQLKRDEKFKNKSMRIILAVPYNEEQWKKSTGYKNPLSSLDALLDDFFRRYQVELKVINFTEQEYAPLFSHVYEPEPYSQLNIPSATPKI